MFVEVFYIVVIVACCRCVRLYDGNVEMTSSQADVIESVVHLPTAHDGFQDVLVNKKTDTALMFVLSPTKYILWPSKVEVSRIFYRNSQSPRMFQWYLLISLVSSSSLPAALSVLIFQVPTYVLPMT